MAVSESLPQTRKRGGAFPARRRYFQGTSQHAVVAGHISSDNLGVNLMLDGLEKKYGQLEFVECSGFRRFRR